MVAKHTGLRKLVRTPWICKPSQFRITKLSYSYFSKEMYFFERYQSYARLLRSWRAVCISNLKFYFYDVKRNCFPVHVLLLN